MSLVDHREVNGHLKRRKPTKRRQFSKISNGKWLLPNIDRRSAWYRRYKDLVSLHASDLGGLDQVTHSEMALIRRAAALIVETERREAIFANNGEASDAQIEIHQKLSNTLRRLLESLGLQRRMKTVQSFMNGLAIDADRRQHDQAMRDEERRKQFEQRQRERSHDVVLEQQHATTTDD